MYVCVYISTPGMGEKPSALADSLKRSVSNRRRRVRARLSGVVVAEPAKRGPGSSGGGSGAMIDSRCQMPFSFIVSIIARAANKTPRSALLPLLTRLRMFTGDGSRSRGVQRSSGDDNQPRQSGPLTTFFPANPISVTSISSIVLENKGLLDSRRTQDS